MFMDSKPINWLTVIADFRNSILPLTVDEICVFINTSDLPLSVSPYVKFGNDIESNERLLFKRGRKGSLTLNKSMKKALHLLEKDDLESLQVEIDKLLETE